MSIIVIGDICVDEYSYGKSTRLSPEAPIPVMEIYKEDVKLGMSANVVNNINSLGNHGILLSVAGPDNEELSNLCNYDKINKQIKFVSDRVTTRKKRIICNDQPICRIDKERKTYIDIVQESFIFDRLKDNIQSCDSVIIQDYGKGVCTKGVIFTTIELAARYHKPVCIDPCKHTNPNWYKNASILKANLDEATTMCNNLGHYNKGFVEMLNILHKELNINKVIITMGESGMGILDDGRISIIPAHRVNVVDVTGAGDTAIAALMVALSNKLPFKEAAEFANLAASKVVCKQGTSIVSIEELCQ